VFPGLEEVWKKVISNLFTYYYYISCILYFD
jgi:hypothetical protein